MMQTLMLQRLTERRMMLHFCSQDEAEGWGDLVSDASVLDGWGEEERVIVLCGCDQPWIQQATSYQRG